MKNIKQIGSKFLSLIFFVGTASLAIGQIPQNIEPGQDQKSVNLYEQPEYIIPILTLFVVLAGFYFWRRNRNRRNEK